MPSNEELKKAHDEERADGWGILEGNIPDEWPSMHAKAEQSRHEETLLESGQLLKHHKREHCSGNCCLHGTSTYGSCRMPRQWRYDRGIIEHLCPHGIGHPCYAGLAYAIAVGDSNGDGVHGCDGCCVSVNNDPFDHNGYLLMKLDADVEILNEAIGWVQNDIEKLQDQMRAYKTISILSLVSVIAFIALAVAFAGATQ